MKPPTKDRSSDHSRPAPALNAGRQFGRVVRADSRRVTIDGEVRVALENSTPADSSEGMATPLILVVDDQPCVAHALRRLLEHAGMDALTATSPLEATAIWGSRKADIDLLMTDFDLDDPVTGEQLARNFEAEKPNLKSFILSAYPMDDHRFPGRIEGVDFFQKPWDCAALVLAVQRLLQNAKQVSSAPEAPVN